MNNIFISYRREDSEGFARGLFQSLVGAFGANHVFMDVEAISLGADFVKAIDNSLASCGALLVLIGKEWGSCTDGAGNRRLDNPHDFVRMEVAKALEKKGVRVIPVLVKGAVMPRAESLPEELRSVTRRQALELRHERWNQDVEHLVAALADLLGLERMDHRAAAGPPPPERPTGKSGARKLVGGLAAAVLIVALIFVGYLMTAPGPEPDFDARRSTVDDPAASPTATNINPSGDKRAAPAPESPPTANVKPRKKTPQAVDLTGMWVNAEGINVQIAQRGNEVISQAYDPMNGMTINAVWQVSGRRVAFNWASNMGNQGVGEGTIAADGNTIDYRFVDHYTGEQGYSRLFRVNQ